MIANRHPREMERLEALHRYDILDTPVEAEFDEVVDLASRICETPISVINLIDANRQWFKAETGLGVRSTPLDTSICAHVILEHDFVEIEDTLRDSRMSDNPLCQGESGLRFYAGALLKTADGLPLGTLCVLDNKPRNLSTLQRDAIRVLAHQVMRHLELRLALKHQEILRREVDHRVKNSLQTVSSIVRLQARRSPEVAVTVALDAITTRLNAIIAVHEELHQAGEGEHVELDSLIPRLAALQNAISPHGVTVIANVERRSVSTAEASALGMLINEFVANAFKHVYALGAEGVITIRGLQQASGYHIQCSDGGSGISDIGAAVQHSKGLGMKIIAASAQTLESVAKWSSGADGVQLTLKLADRSRLS